MQALIELIAAFVAFLASITLSQFGVDLQTPRQPDREIHRTHDCNDAGSTVVTQLAVSPDKSC